MSDMPSVFRRAWRTARTTHVCCECRRQIQPGEEYESSTGCWDGRWSTYKTCDVCMDLRDRIETESHYYDELPAFTELYEYADNCEYLCEVRHAG